MHSKRLDIPVVMRLNESEQLKLPVGHVSSEVVLLLAADNEEQLPVPGGGLGPLRKQVRAHVDEIVRLEEGDVVGVESRRAHVGLDLPQQLSLLVRKPRVAAVAAQRDRKSTR